MALLCGTVTTQRRHFSQSRKAHLDQALLGQARARKEGLGLTAGQPPIAVPVGLRKPGVRSRVRHAVLCALAALRTPCCCWPSQFPARSCWGSRGPCSRLARQLAALDTGAQMRWQGRQCARRSAPGAWRGRTGARTPGPGSWGLPCLRAPPARPAQVSLTGVTQRRAGAGQEGTAAPACRGPELPGRAPSGWPA